MGPRPTRVTNRIRSLRTDADGRLWTGGGTVTCIQGHAEL